jgi:hypothetical protein
VNHPIQDRFGSCNQTLRFGSNFNIRKDLLAQILSRPSKSIGLPSQTNRERDFFLVDYNPIGPPWERHWCACWFVLLYKDFNAMQTLNTIAASMATGQTSWNGVLRSTSTDSVPPILSACGHLHQPPRHARQWVLCFVGNGNQMAAVAVLRQLLAVPQRAAFGPCALTEWPTPHCALLHWPAVRLMHWVTTLDPRLCWVVQANQGHGPTRLGYMLTTSTWVSAPHGIGLLCPSSWTRPKGKEALRGLVCMDMQVVKHFGFL